MKRWIAGLLALCLLCACAGGTSSAAPAASSQAASSQPASSQAASSAPAESAPIDTDALLGRFWSETAFAETPWAPDEFPQLAEAQNENTPRVRITTSKGAFVAALYPEAAPYAVLNFLVHCQEGYYDGSAFHRIMKNFMIQSGIPQGSAVGESIWGIPFPNEQSDQLRHFDGALAMANRGAHTNTSQFYIIRCDEKVLPQQEQRAMFIWYYNEVRTRLAGLDRTAYTEEELSALIQALKESVADAEKNGVPAEVAARYRPAFEAYLEHGGKPTIDYSYTVFGQVIEGMDVIDAIANVEVTAGANGEMSVPVEEVTILSTEIL